MSLLNQSKAMQALTTIQPDNQPHERRDLPAYFYEEATALPSVLASNEETKSLTRGIYGGEGDKAHLGGFTDLDLDGVSPSVWKDMISHFGIKSLLDVGCGKGVSTSFFAVHGVEVLCVEGSHDAVQQSMLPDPKTQVVEHDFSRGPWWPSKTVDAVWCVEFTEHVGRNFHVNYFPAFKKAAIIFVTHSTWGGWHHVEVHTDEYWRAKYESNGFVFSGDLTSRVKDIAVKERENNTEAFNGKRLGATHVARSIQVFINPLVASLPEHSHLFAEPGCFTDYGKPKHDCGTGRNEEHISKLPEKFKALRVTSDMELQWKTLISKSLPTDSV